VPPKLFSFRRREARDQLIRSSRSLLVDAITLGSGVFCCFCFFSSPSVAGSRRKHVTERSPRSHFDGRECRLIDDAGGRRRYNPLRPGAELVIREPAISAMMNTEIPLSNVDAGALECG
jgi:hypothetical protein